MKDLKFLSIALLSVALMGIFSLEAHAAPIQRMTQRVKLAGDQAVIERQYITDPSAAGTTQILNGVAGPTSAAIATITTFAGQPDVPRNLVITPGGTTTDVEACVITVNGTNIFNKAISETFTFTADQSAAVTGNKAFKTVTSVVFPANCESGGFAATWSIGRGEKLGLQWCLPEAGAWIQSSTNGTKETTAATVATSASAVEGNTADFNGTMNGTNDFVAYYIQNFACQP